LDTADVIQAISAGICFYAGVLHLMIGLRSRPRNRMHLSFAVVSLLWAIYSTNLFILYAAFKSGSLTHYVAVDRWGLATYYLGYASLFWFIAAYTGTTRRLVLWIITGLYVGIAMSCYILPYPWVYTDIELTSTFPPNITIAPWYPFEMVITLFIFLGYTTYGTVRQYRRGQRAPAQALGIAVGIFVATYAYDVLLVEQGLVESVLVQQYGFVAFIVIMSLRLSGQTIEAEKEVRRLNVELEQRVEERTAELSKANQGLIKARDEAQAANRAKSLFLTNMSHELRTPLNAILGHTQTMARDQSMTSDQRHSVEAVKRSGDHLLTLINSVLEMSKIEAGRMALSPSPFAIETLLNDMEMMFDSRASDKNLGFEVKREPETLLTINADRGKISQILINLLSNAIKHTLEGHITLRASVAGMSGDWHRLVFEVEDTGEGIAANELERIFEPFVQSGGTSPQQTGTGLGLAISRQYARVMDGDLTVKSRVGEGSVFRLELPLVEVEVAPLEQDLILSRRIVGIAGEKQDFRVLLVDDVPSNRDVLIRLLEPVGFMIREAADGREALDWFESWSPHLILMDIRMPTMDGKEAIKKIKATQRGQTTPVIGLSASAFDEDRKEVLESGADDFIGKPIRESELWEKIERLLKIDLVFEEAASSFKPSSAVEEKVLLTREDFAVLPEEILEDMRAAVRGGYMERLAELAKKVADIQPKLSQHLLKMVDQYDYESLSCLVLGDEDDKQNKD
jgi:signal transduction histidine kinase/CheY-like chemotaxis protein